MWRLWLGVLSFFVFLALLGTGPTTRVWYYRSLQWAMVWSLMIHQNHHHHQQCPKSKSNWSVLVAQLPSTVKDKDKEISSVHKSAVSRCVAGTFICQLKLANVIRQSLDAKYATASAFVVVAATARQCSLIFNWSKAEFNYTDSAKSGEREAAELEQRKKQQANPQIIVPRKHTGHRRPSTDWNFRLCNLKASDTCSWKWQFVLARQYIIATKWPLPLCLQLKLGRARRTAGWHRLWAHSNTRNRIVWLDITWDDKTYQNCAKDGGGETFNNVLTFLIGKMRIRRIEVRIISELIKSLTYLSHWAWQWMARRRTCDRAWYPSLRQRSLDWPQSWHCRRATGSYRRDERHRRGDGGGRHATTRPQKTSMRCSMTMMNEPSRS